MAACNNDSIVCWVFLLSFSFSLPFSLSIFSFSLTFSFSISLSSHSLGFHYIGMDNSSLPCFVYGACLLGHFSKRKISIRTTSAKNPRIKFSTNVPQGTALKAIVHCTVFCLFPLFLLTKQKFAGDNSNIGDTKNFTAFLHECALKTKLPTFRYLYFLLMI